MDLSVNRESNETPMQWFTSLIHFTTLFGVKFIGSPRGDSHQNAMF